MRSGCVETDACIVGLSMRCRYQTEVAEGKSSCLKKLTQHDSPPGRPMVLILASLILPASASEIAADNRGSGEGGDTSDRPPAPAVRFLLTDGWYGMTAVPDWPLLGLLMEGKLQVRRGNRKVCVAWRCAAHASKRHCKRITKEVQLKLQEGCTGLRETVRN